MNNVQLYIIMSGVAASIVTVILGWMQTNARLSRLETTTDGSIRDLRISTETGFRKVEAMQEIQARDLREFYRMLGRLEGRVEEIAKRKLKPPLRFLYGTNRTPLPYFVHPTSGQYPLTLKSISLEL